MSRIGLICRDCPYQDIWHADKTSRDRAKHETHTTHEVERVDPDDLDAIVAPSGRVARSTGRQTTLADGGRDGHEPDGGESGER
jgi:hypothetical protein